MRAAAPVALLLSSILCAACATGAQPAAQPEVLSSVVTVTTDSARNRSQIQTTQMQLENELQLQAGHALSDTSHSVLLVFTSSSDHWRFLESRSLVIVVDDSVRIEPPVESQARVGLVHNLNGHESVTEIMAARITEVTYHRLATARTALGELGPVHFSLSPSQLAILRELDEKLTP